MTGGVPRTHFVPATAQGFPAPSSPTSTVSHQEVPSEHAEHPHVRTAVPTPPPAPSFNIIIQQLLFRIGDSQKIKIYRVKNSKNKYLTITDIKLIIQRVCAGIAILGFSIGNQAVAQGLYEKDLFTSGVGVLKKLADGAVDKLNQGTDYETYFNEVVIRSYVETSIDMGGGLL